MDLLRLGYISLSGGSSNTKPDESEGAWFFKVKSRYFTKAGQDAKQAYIMHGNSKSLLILVSLPPYP